VNRQFISTQEPLASLRSSRCQQCGWIPSCFIRVACVKFRSFSMGWAQVVLSGHDSRIRRETRKRDVDNFTLESYPNHDQQVRSGANHSKKKSWSAGGAGRLSQLRPTSGYFTALCFHSAPRFAPCQLARSFSRQHGFSDFACDGSASRLRMYEARIYLDLSLHAYPRTTNAWAHLPSCVPPSLPSPGPVGSTRRSSP
jgi:hypothetical protein